MIGGIGVMRRKENLAELRKLFKMWETPGWAVEMENLGTGQAITLERVLEGRELEDLLCVEGMLPSYRHEFLGFMQGLLKEVKEGYVK